MAVSVSVLQYDKISLSLFLPRLFLYRELQKIEIMFLFHFENIIAVKHLFQITFTDQCKRKLGNKIENNLKYS